MTQNAIRLSPICPGKNMVYLVPIPTPHDTVEKLESAGHPVGNLFVPILDVEDSLVHDLEFAI